ncbi:MAG: suppressor of loss of ypt1 [Sclerophora amabilis]|nr:MAG: suppressor of loss of ypt1 [Sclerophora amabilis]
MPHSISINTERRSPASSSLPLPVKSPTGSFPAFSNDTYAFADQGANTRKSGRSPSPVAQNGSVNGPVFNERWQPKKDVPVTWGNGGLGGKVPRRARQKSLSDAFKTIRTRGGSVSDNAHELADALKAPVSARLVTLCVIWYLTSALTNTSSKSILNAFPKPVTLTVVQFAFVSSWCIFFSYLARIYPVLKDTIPALRHGIRSPTREVITTTLPLAVFQVGGHLLSSTATSKIPVSLVHTIKGLSPLFTVIAYRLVFRIHYSSATYLSLIPLTFGVMLACSAELSGNFFGILCAFGGAIIFVTQNIFSKKLFNEAARAEADGQYQRSQKLDKLNLLCYSSGLAFALTAPFWLWSEGFTLLGDFFHDGALDLSGKKDALQPGRLTLEFLFNGTFHFGQNIMAFILLSMVSPVTYSVASLIKRIFVIVVAIVWFGSSTTPVQAFGIALTFIGLYLYDRTSDAAKADRRARLQQTKGQDTLLPLSTVQERSDSFVDSPLSSTSGQLYGGISGFANNINTSNGNEPTADIGNPGRSRSSSVTNGLHPTTIRQDLGRDFGRPVEPMSNPGFSVA